MSFFMVYRMVSLILKNICIPMQHKKNSSLKTEVMIFFIRTNIQQINQGLKKNTQFSLGFQGIRNCLEIYLSGNVFKWCAIKVKSFNAIIVCIYRPPRSDDKLFFSIFNELLDFLVDSNKAVIIGGYFSIDIIIIHLLKCPFMD